MVEFFVLHTNIRQGLITNTIISHHDVLLTISLGQWSLGQWILGNCSLPCLQMLG
jgi:hypothetical protein